MAKRRATTELNRDNWDVEEESEEPGTFRKLSEEELKNRIIRKAKRTLANKETSGSSPFAAFSGFSKCTSNTNPFGFLKKENSSLNTDDKKENGNSMTSEGKTDAEATDKKLHTQKPIRSIEYYRQLQSLNESIMKWMQLHLAKNSCCDFTPVFNDYKKHLDTLNVTYPVRVKEGAVTAILKESLSEKTSTNAVNHEFQKTNSNNSHKSDEETDYGANFKSNTTNTSTFSFGIKSTPTATSSNTLRPTTSLREEEPDKKSFQFSFGLQKSTEDSNVMKPFSFAMDKNVDSESATTEESEYMPPKNDFIAVKEEDAFYSKRCKLFYKKNDTYVERGIGVLHLKPLDGKTQLLIRADTSLGNILLNILLSESLPMSKVGKNNVLLVCVPNPPLDTKISDSKETIPMLIRVKSSEDAEELLETLNKHKS